jgi:S-adenosylmethionine hydrolase
VLTYILLQEESHRAVALSDPRYWRDADPSYTFHGRDIFSPAAAHLAGGVPLDELGPPCEDLIRFPLPPLDVTSDAIRGEIIRIDRFGNALTDIARLEWLDEGTLEFRPLDPDLAQDTPPRFEAAGASVSVGWHRFDGVRHRYGEVAPGHPLALVGSGGELEVSVNQGSAQDQLGLKIGDAATLYLGRS